MFKISFYIRKKNVISSDEFRTYWLGEHAELQKQYLEELGVRCYIKCEALPDDPVSKASVEAYQTEGGSYDFVDHWLFNDMQALKTGSENPAITSSMEAVFASEDKFIDTAECMVGMSVDIVQFYPIKDYRATPDNSFVKIYYCVRKLSELTIQQAQLHWNACHGAVSRQDIKYSVQSKYVQAHNIESTFVNEIAAKRGFNVDPDFIGHAEGWIDGAVSAPKFPADEAAEIVSMSMDDIDLFADKERGQLFTAKEHFIIDKPVIVRPMPKLFSAVY